MAKKTNLPKSENLPATSGLAGRTNLPLAPVRRSAVMESAEQFAPGEKLKLISGGRIVKPSDVGEGVMVRGRVTAIRPSPVKRFKSQILDLEHPSGDLFSFPVTAVIEASLARHFEVERDKLDLTQAVGLNLVIVGRGKVPCAGDAKKTVNVFDVYIAE